MDDLLTPKQRTILEFIESYIDVNHSSPTLREIGSHFDLSVGTVQDQVHALHKKGFLNRESSKARTLRIPGKAAQQIPILGQVHAGPLHESLEHLQGYLPVGTTLSASKHFALRVKGDSMIDAGILEDDLVIVRFQPAADPGDVIVARVDGETTVKKFDVQDGQPLLIPANERYHPIVGRPFDVVGVVVEVRRHLKNWRV